MRGGTDLFTCTVKMLPFLPVAANSQFISEASMMLHLLLETGSFSENSSFFLSPQHSQDPQVANMEVNIKVGTMYDLLPWCHLICA